jgi:hypothetical protein
MFGVPTASGLELTFLTPMGRHLTPFNADTAFQRRSKYVTPLERQQTPLKRRVGVPTAFGLLERQFTPNNAENLPFTPFAL